VLTLTLTRTKYQLTQNRVQLRNRLEALLEEAHIKLSNVVSDLLGLSARRMLHALADGATDAGALAALANVHVRATQEQLRDALGACQDLDPVYRRLVRMALADLQLLEQQMAQVDQELAHLLSPYQDQVQRLAEVPGLARPAGGAAGSIFNSYWDIPGREISSVCCLAWRSDRAKGSTT
jgi:transposase